MTRPGKPLIKAILIAPWVVLPVTAVYAAGRLISWLGKPLPDPSVTMLFPHPFKPWETICLYSLYGVPTAYASLLLVGLPAYLVAEKRNQVSVPAALLASVLACIPAALFFGGFHNFWQMLGFLLLNGVPIALVFLWLARRDPERIVGRR
jgi:hypothetical protein